MTIFHWSGGDMPEIDGLDRVVLLQDVPAFLGRNERTFFRHERKRLNAFLISKQVKVVRYSELMALKAEMEAAEAAAPAMAG